MGFKAPKRSALITFEDTPFDGLEITARLDVTMEALFELSALQEQEGTDMEKARHTLEYFADKIVSGWNLEEEDGEPVPFSFARLWELGPIVVLRIVPAWQEAAVGVPTPLVSPSSGESSSAA